MGKKFLIDTNTLIDAQTHKLSENGLRFLADVINEDFTISFITYIEFLGYKNATKAMEEFIALANVVQIDTVIIDICISLRKTQRIKLADTIIAATALANGYTLITNNEKDFINIKNLDVVNLHKI
ncbi:type II toxin-antitoxin system VapC family toxin [Dyadobacter subterraneus]|uniref:Type II toxin-antitoxin system VapC family toxin n=1 Tax=Dyadobacter subterraneus TaxID=2773304 RepID=A0ABR9WJB6_9BACT|nr:type II toxin-antitoxin system VapC family toxin [Dyadobacter subterraneus]MBE9465219.1 type II toxin-antitoxin system VapC family toxin [Dyadobacter subterraneus]